MKCKNWASDLLGGLGASGSTYPVVSVARTLWCKHAILTIVIRYGLPMICVLFDRIAKLGIVAVSTSSVKPSYSPSSRLCNGLTSHGQIHPGRYGNGVSGITEHHLSHLFSK